MTFEFHVKLRNGTDIIGKANGSHVSSALYGLAQAHKFDMSMIASVEAKVAAATYTMKVNEQERDALLHLLPAGGRLSDSESLVALRNRLYVTQPDH